MQFDQLKRREFITLLGGAAAWPLAARAQQPMPVVGYLDFYAAEPTGIFLAAFRKGLSETGFIEGRNLAIEYRYANTDKDRLPQLVAVVSSDQFFTTRRVQFATLATHYRVPAIYSYRAFPEVGGLMSYGPSLPDQYRQLGVYTGRMLNGEKPAELPVQAPTKFELVINLGTSKTLGLTIPPGLLVAADEVIE